MSSEFRQAIEDLMKDYRTQLDKATEVRQKMSELTVTVAAVRQTVKATVGSRGELTALEFPTSAYKTLPPKELASIIVATVTQAREKIAEQVAELVAPTLPPGFDARAMMSGSADVREVLSDEPRTPDAVREYVDNGRRGAPGAV